MGGVEQSSHGALTLMTRVWNATQRHEKEDAPEIGNDLDLKESMGWDEMKTLLEGEKQLDEETSPFVSSTGTAAYASVSSTIVHVVCKEDLTEEEECIVRSGSKSEEEKAEETSKATKGTQLKLPLETAERLIDKLDVVRYPSGYDPSMRSLIEESLKVFDLNDIHPAFYTLGRRLALLCKDDDLKTWLEDIGRQRFDHLLQSIANDEEIQETGIAPESAERFLSEEEKEVLREWRADIASVHDTDSAFGIIEKQFRVRRNVPRRLMKIELLQMQYGIMDA